MAFDFLGTFNEAEYISLKAFAELELEDVESRIAALTIQRGRMESLHAKYLRSEDSYLLGTDEKKVSDFYKMDPDAARGDSLQQVAIKNTIDSDAMTDDDRSSVGEALTSVEKRRNYADLDPAKLMTKLKDWLRPVIRLKRDNIQYNIMKLRDQQEFINKQIIQLSTRKSELEDLFIQLENIIASTDYAGVKR